jgi:hypothetical protein
MNIINRTFWIGVLASLFSVVLVFVFREFYEGRLTLPPFDLKM